MTIRHMLLLITAWNVNDIKSLTFSLEDASKSSSIWFDSNLMKNKADKCQLLVRSNEKVTHSLPMHPFSTHWKQKTWRCFQGVEKGCIGNECVKMGSHDINNTKRGKLLGIHLDRELSFDYHISKIFKKQTKNKS